MNSLKKIQKFEFDVSPHVTIFWFIKKNIWLGLRFNWTPMGSLNVSTYIQLGLNTIELCSFTTRCLSQMRLSKQATLKLLYYHDWAKWLQNLLVSVKHREGGCPNGTATQVVTQTGPVEHKRADLIKQPFVILLGLPIPYLLLSLF